MNLGEIFHTECQKLIGRNQIRILTLITILIFPSIVRVVLLLDKPAEGLLLSRVEFGMLSFSESYLFLPVWIFIFIGQEFSNGHAQRIIFARGKDYFFVSKVIDCLLFSLFYLFVAAIAFWFVVITYHGTLEFSIIDFLKFVVQSLFCFSLYGLLLLTIVFFFRSSIYSFVFYFIWHIVEGITFTLLDKTMGIKSWWLPIHLVNTVFVKNGEVMSENYFSLSSNNMAVIIFPLIEVVALLFIVRLYFQKKDLRPLSD